MITIGLVCRTVLSQVCTDDILLIAWPWCRLIVNKCIKMEKVNNTSIMESSSVSVKKRVHAFHKIR